MPEDIVLGVKCKIHGRCCFKTDYFQCSLYLLIRFLIRIRNLCHFLLNSTNEMCILYKSKSPKLCLLQLNSQLNSLGQTNPH